MSDALDGLRRLRGVVGAMVIARDGSLIADSFAADGEDDALAGMLAALFGLASQSLVGFGLGALRESTFETSEGLLYFTEAQNDRLLVIAANRQVNLGLLRLEGRRAARQIG